jgi:hypothetical protein
MRVQDEQTMSIMEVDARLGRTDEVIKAMSDVEKSEYFSAR